MIRRLVLILLVVLIPIRLVISIRCFVVIGWLVLVGMGHPTEHGVSCVIDGDAPKQGGELAQFARYRVQSTEFLQGVDKVGRVRGFREAQSTFPRVIPMIDVGTQVVQAANDAVVTRSYSNDEWGVASLIAEIDGNSRIPQIEN